MRQSQRCHLRHSDYCSPSAVSVLMWTDGPCVFKACRLQSWKDFNTHWYGSNSCSQWQHKPLTKSASTRTGLESVSGLGFVCVHVQSCHSKHGPAFLGCCRRNGSGIAQSMPVWACPSPWQPCKSRKCLADRNAKQSLNGVTGGYYGIHTQRQAFTGSRIQLPQAGKHKASTNWDRCRTRTQTNRFHTSRNTADVLLLWHALSILFHSEMCRRYGC